MTAAIEALGTSPLPATGSRARLGAYASWQVRDYLMDRGAPTALIGLLFGYMVGGPMVGAMNMSLARMSPAAIARAGGLDAARDSMVTELTASFLTVALGNLVFLGALFAMNGIIANDRKLGYYRFLFSKPISPERYYGQAFVLHWAGFLFVSSILGLLYQALVGPVLGAPLYVAVALLSHWYGTTDATDRCYRAAIGKQQCRPLASSARPPLPLAGGRG